MKSRKWKSFSPVILSVLLLAAVICSDARASDSFVLHSFTGYSDTGSGHRLFTTGEKTPFQIHFLRPASHCFFIPQPAKLRLSLRNIFRIADSYSVTGHFPYVYLRRRIPDNSSGTRQNNFPLIFTISYLHDQDGEKG